MTRIILLVSANGQPITEKKQTFEIMSNNRVLANKVEQKGSMKRSVWPQHLVEPQYMEGYFEESWQASIQ